MKRPSPAVRPLAAVAAGVLFLGACSSGGSPGASDDGPLAEFFGDTWAFDEDEMAERDRLREEAIAACMAEAGFEYIPNTSSYSYSFDDEDIDWGSVEFAEEYGYAMSIEGPGSSSLDDEEEYHDPNWELVETMSESEQDAYYSALYGDMSYEEEYDEDGELIDSFEWNPEEQGCDGAAWLEVNPESSMEFSDEMQDAFTAMWDRVESDERVLEASRAWVTCMADAGHDGFTSPDSASERFMDEVDALYEEIVWEDMYDEDSFDEDFDGGMFPGVDPERLAELQDRERAVATADARCREDVDFEGTLTAVSRDYEQELVDQFRPELEAFRDAQSKSSDD